MTFSSANISLLEDWGNPESSDLSEALKQAATDGKPLRDFVTANPQVNGFAFDEALLADILAGAAREARVYAPDSSGRLTAREAVAAYHGDGLTADQVVLTPGTSFGYWAAFRLLAELHGGEVLCPSPTYPLFDDLARLAGLSVRRYHLYRQGPRWVVDPEELAFQITPRTRAIALVSPHNPTGSVANMDDLMTVGRLARRHNLAVIFDEVFREFVHRPEAVVSRPAEFGAPLVITLNGLSKMLSLPGLKGAWMAVEGEPELTRPFLRSLDYLADTFLPVSEITQAAMPRLLRDGADETRRFAALYTSGMRSLRTAWQSDGGSVGAGVVMPEAGPYLTIDLGEADTRRGVLRLVRDHGILVHSGDMYDMTGGHLVMTAVAPPPYPIAEIMGAMPD